MSDLRRCVIDGKLYNVVSSEDYVKNPNLYPIGLTAIDTDNTILPLRNKTDFSPGLYKDPESCLFDYRKPTASELPMFLKDNLEIVDLGNNKSSAEFIKKNQRVKEINRSILENDDDNFVCTRTENDTPEMTLFKNCIDEKEMNIKKYQARIEANCGNYNNAVRLLNKESISFDKMKKLAKSFDMKVGIYIENSEENIPNPIKEVHSCIITGGESDGED